jgi:hypothetical protein
VEIQKLRILQELLNDEVVISNQCAPFNAEMVASYIDAELSGRDAATIYPAVKIHLESCAACQKEYAELKRLLQFEHSQTLHAPPVLATFDFSYLVRETGETPATKPKDVAEHVWHLDEIGRLIIRFSDRLLQTLQAKPQSLTYAMERSDEEADLLYQFTLQQVIEDRNIAITVSQMRDTSHFCTVIVEVDIPSRGGWPNLTETVVVLKRGITALQTQMTDAFGKTAFRDISTDDLPQLVFEITASQSSAPDR